MSVVIRTAARLGFTFAPPAGRRVHHNASGFAAFDVDQARIDVVGGTPTGWAALLTTFASRELESERRVQVLDLTATAAAAQLAAAARAHGFAVTTCVLPEQLAELEFAADLDAHDVREVVEHVLGPDDALLHTLLDVLGDRATLARLAAALEVVLGRGGTGLSATELAALVSVKAERRHALALYHELTAIADAGTRAAGADDADLGVYALDGRGNEYDSAILRSFLVHATLRTQRGGTLAVCGAERLPAHTLERLLQAAATKDLGLILFYADFTEEVAPLIGRDQATVAYMRLGNAAGARRAAERIGPQRLALSRAADAASDALSDRIRDAYSRTSTRREAARVDGGWGAGWPVPEPDGTRELTVTPETLRSLPRTAAIVVRDGRATAIDANPALSA